ncbi:hypothetical protein F4801DRAFT_553524 [Xylaria longipes]|nr:hypothetical protein F4801DRAFT_553524 [Xylaria longipes]
MFGDEFDQSISAEQLPNTEHHLVPILKLIDFGDAYEITVPEALPQRRAYDQQLRLAARMEDDLKKLQGMGKSPNDGREEFRKISGPLTGRPLTGHPSHLNYTLFKGLFS